MYIIHGLKISSNTTKILYVAEELGVDYQFIQMSLSKGEHKTDEHMKRHPLGKVPTLTHNNKTLFESNSICRYLAGEEKSALYPLNDNFLRCQVDQWMDFFTNHLGRWLNSYAFEKVAKAKFSLGEPNKASEKEALGFIEQQMPAVEKHLASHKYFTGDNLTIADPIAFAYLENAEIAQVPLDSFPRLKSWYENMKSRQSVVRAKNKMAEKQ